MIFPTIDLTAGFWLLFLHPRTWPYTASKVPEQEQYQWASCQSFQRLMETLVHGHPSVFIYIDDLLMHSSTHPEHHEQRDSLLNSLI